MKIDDIESLFSENRRKFKEIINRIDPNVFKRKHDEKSWSPSEECHHIYLVKKGIKEILSNLCHEIHLEKEVSITEIPVRNFFQKITYEKMPELPMPGTEPSNEFSKEQMLEMMTDVSIQIDGYFQDCKKFDCSSMKAAHPFIGSMNFYEWLFFDGIHEKCHLDHINTNI